jgi:hypothetical protein
MTTGIKCFRSVELFALVQPLPCVQRNLARMTEMSSLRHTTRLSAIVLLAIVLNASAASAQASLGSAQRFAALAGTGVTCTDSTVTGDVGVWPGIVVTQTGCTVAGAVHAADSVAQRAYLDFINAYNNLRDHPPACRATATATLAEALLPGVYCVDSTAKTGPLILDARGDANAVWLFLVDGALTGTNFTVTMINGGQPCNVAWWVKAAATLTDSKFLGTILAGAAITVTRGTLVGHAWATAAATLTGAPTLRLAVSACRSSSGSFPPAGDKCEERHDNDRDDDDRDGDHHDKEKRKGGKDKDKDHNDNDGKDKDRESKDKKRG